MKLAIIGTSIGQAALYQKAREMGLDVVSFSRDKGVIREVLLGDFHQISIVEVDQIVRICRDAHVDGVVTNASTLATEIVSKVAGFLGLPCTSCEALKLILDKSFVRGKTNLISGLLPVESYIYKGERLGEFPCVVKPISGGGKLGVSLAVDANSFERALRYVPPHTKILVEDFIEGDEVSVESLSYKGCHLVVQITDKISTGAPHFVELAHSQPSRLPDQIKQRIRSIVPRLLTAVGFETGPSHTELKVTKDGEIALVEINPRGGGDEISSTLVGLSTDFDYIKGMIDVALGRFVFPQQVRDVAYCGIRYVCEQTKHLLSLYESCQKEKWLFERREMMPVSDMRTATGNHDRNAYFIYRSMTPMPF